MKKNNSEIGIGVIGAGGMGRSILHRVLALDERLKVRGILDPNPKSIEKTRQKCGIDPTIYNNLEDLVTRAEIDWVMIASWNCFHAEQVVAALNADKHVFSQKPLCLSLSECEEMQSAWNRSGRMFNLGFTLRYAPHYRKIKHLIAEGNIGDIISMEFNETLEFNHGGFIMGDWRRLRQNAGTHLLEKCCHDIDLANWMTNGLPTRVASFGGLNFFLPENEYHIARIGKNERGQPAYHAMGGRNALNPFTSDKDLMDNQVAIIEYDNGIRATFHANCNAAIPERRMYILGSKGTIRADLVGGKIEIKRIGFDTAIEDVSTLAKGGHGGGDDILSSELVDSMINQTPPSVGMIEGIKSAVTCFAIDEAMERGKVVDVMPYWNRLGIK